MHFLEIEKYIIVDFFLFLVKSNSMIEKKGGYEQKTYSRLGANTLSAGSEQKKSEILTELLFFRNARKVKPAQP